MEIRTGEALEAVRRKLGMDLGHVWLGYISLGGIRAPRHIQEYLRGQASLDPHQHDVLAQAINECALERGGNHPAPYAEQVFPDA